MPFLGVLPERKWLFKPEPTRDVGVSDAETWRLNPAHRHIYNKLTVAHAQGLLAAPCGVDPLAQGCSAETRLFIKPIINLAGMSLGTQTTTADHLRTDRTLCNPGSFWCEFLAGEQTSTDCLVRNGQALWFAHTRAAGEKSANRPVYWEVGVPLPKQEPRIASFISTHLAGYTGLCNLEMIGDWIIEVHLRGSNGFFDLYGDRFFQSWVELVDHERWLEPGEIPGGIVYSVFSTKNRILDISAVALPEGIYKVIPDQQTTDRLAIIHAANLGAAKTMASRLLKLCP